MSSATDQVDTRRNRAPKGHRVLVVEPAKGRVEKRAQSPLGDAPNDVSPRERERRLGGRGHA